MAIENLPRRQFLRGKFLVSSQQKNTPAVDVIRPPWSIGEREFVDKCTRCNTCFTTCETKILIKGDGGFPEVRFENGECTFCKKCAEVCPQPIFRPLDEKPWEHIIDIGENCLTQRRIECRSCQDNCPMNAIRFHLQMGGVAQPSVNGDTCNGCGACIKSCPVNAIKIVKNE
ncbi:ferredoxin-type protein NapF [Rodentibacter trehalosifermentans]|uniref:Ferredoxin-type protein NapF n=1 Tax=Rodentibacter trehalosifermentans TaxID=1908263 RepID=A0A1V3IUM8_9PAST|nr:ferredoxin-type protein NapF [Rodentibacter trehalosifermentans]OOF45644.1 ferredoxin-type protein NapF [Rodentibacter trehalosifermentans]OOF47376.1 ferredoxin-type protein NapF [Rodentibacter trehalosifermentans]